MRRVFEGARCGLPLLAGIWFAVASPVMGQEVVLTEQDDARLQVVDVWGDRPVDSPGAISVLTQEDIVAAAADHPAEVLNTLPGVNIHLNSGQEHLIAIRSPVLTGGAGQGSFLILENGVPTRSPAFGNVNSLIEPHHEVARAIEVVRGPGSAKYGSNAVHGLINVIYGVPGEGSRASASYGSLGRYKGDLILDNGDTLRGALSVQKDTGWRDNTGGDQQKLTLVGRYDLGGWAATPFVSISNLEQETAGFVEGPDAYRSAVATTRNANPEAYRNAFSARVGGRLSRSVGDTGELTVAPYAHLQSMQFAQHFLPNGGVEKNGHTGGGVLAKYEWDASDDLTLRVGADVDVASGYLKEIQLEPFGFFPGDSRFPEGIHYDYTVDTMMGALWGEAAWSPQDDLTVLAGLRAEVHEYDYSTDAPVGINGRFNVPADRTDTFDLLTPKLGVIWTPREISYYANYARGQRAPQASDLYRLQNLQVAGEVEEETLDSFEIGLRGAVLRDALIFDLAAYVAEKENFFFRDGDGLNVPDGSTEHKGVELSASYNLGGAWALRGQMSWSDQNYTFDRIVGSASNSIRDGGRIDTAPEWLGDVALVWTGETGASAQLSAEYIGDYTTDPSGVQKYPGHTVFHARASAPVTDTLEAFVILRNLTDKNYADRADFAFGNERYFPGEPLNVTVGLRKDF